MASQAPKQVFPRGRGGGRGRGDGQVWRGRGGRGGGGRGSWPRGPGRGNESDNARPTHFLSLPLDQHQVLRTRVQTFADGLLASHRAAPIPGFDDRLFQQTQRLHMTLGVMALSESSSPSEASSTNEAPPKKTVAEALDLLNSLRPEIMDIVSDTGGISVPLTGLRIMNAKPEEAHVLWAGPGSQRDGSSLWKISLLVFDRFKAAGFVTDTRPLKLHCTLLNSTFRKPRQAFSSTEILKRVATQPAIAGIPTPTTTTAALAVEDVANRADFGVYAVDEIHLWKMGSWDEEKRYVSSGHISLK